MADRLTTPTKRWMIRLSIVCAFLLTTMFLGAAVYRSRHVTVKLYQSSLASSQEKPKAVLLESSLLAFSGAHDFRLYPYHKYDLPSLTPFQKMATTSPDFVWERSTQPAYTRHGYYEQAANPNTCGVGFEINLKNELSGIGPYENISPESSGQHWIYRFSKSVRIPDGTILRLDDIVQNGTTCFIALGNNRGGLMFGKPAL